MFLGDASPKSGDNGKVGNSYAYLNLRTTLHNFYGKKLNFLFNVVDVAFCNKFEAWMRKNQFEDTTMHYYFLTSAVLTFQWGRLAWNPYKQEILHGDLGDSEYWCSFTVCPNTRSDTGLVLIDFAQSTLVY